VSELDFDALCRWLNERLGRQLAVSVGGPSDGYANTTVVVRGSVRRGEGNVTLIDPAPGRVEAFAIGDALLILLEGDFVAAEALALGSGLVADFGELAVTLNEIAEP
jgi:hypothetical protein